MKYGSLFSLFFWLFLSASQASIHGDYDVWEAADDLTTFPWNGEKISADMRNYIKRTAVFLSGKPGSTFLIGKNCDHVLGAGHSFYNGPGFSLEKDISVFRAPITRGKWADDNTGARNISPHRSMKNTSKDWKTNLKDDYAVVKLNQSANDNAFKESCPIPPTLDLTKPGAPKKLDNCVMIGYQNDIYNPDESKQDSSYINTTGGIKEVDWMTRTISPCSVKAVERRGGVIHDCDTLKGSSGSPLFCKHGEGKDRKWKLVAVQSEDACSRIGDGEESYFSNDTCYVPKKNGVGSKPYSYKFGGDGEYNFDAAVPITSTFQADLDRIPSRASRKYSNTFSSSYSRSIIKKLQKKLAAYDFDVGTPDGIPGKKTRQAIVDFQKYKGWEVTGVIDDKLLAYFQIEQ